MSERIGDPPKGDKRAEADYRANKQRDDDFARQCEDAAIRRDAEAKKPKVLVLSWKFGINAYF